MRLALRAISLSLPILISGCGFMPPAPNDTVHEPRIVRGVLSELYCAVKFLRQRDPLDPRRPLSAASEESDVYKADFLPFDEYWVALIDVHLKTDIEGMATPEFSLLGPLNPANQLLPGRTPGTFNVAAGGTFDNTRTTDREDKFYISINLLMRHWAPPDRYHAIHNRNEYILSDPIDCDHPNEGTYLEGTLGITPWMRRAFQAQQFARFIAPDTAEEPTSTTNANLNPQIPPVYPADPSSWSIPLRVTTPGPDSFNKKGPTGNIPTIGSTFTFIIKGAGHLGPSFTLDHTKGGINTLLTLTRTETNDAYVLLTPSVSETSLAASAARIRHGFVRYHYQPLGTAATTTAQQARALD
jgi:hypothetical protein